MNTIFRFVCLDFRTIKPFRKSIYILILTPIVIGIALKSTSVLAGIFMMEFTIIMSYPFSIGEKNGLDVFYATLPLRRRSVVIGRYAFALIMEIVGVISVFLISILMSIIFKDINTDIQEILFSLCVLFVIFAAVISLQYPLFFKLGYNRARIAAYIPLLAIFLLVMFVVNIQGKSASSSNPNTFGTALSAKPYLIGALLVGTGVLLFALSCALACAWYEKREI